MAATLHIPSASDSQLSSIDLQDTYQRRLAIAELDLQDSRYPVMSTVSKRRPSPSSTPMHSSYSDRPPDLSSNTDASRASWVGYAPSSGRYSAYNGAWVVEKLTEEPREQSLSSHPQARDVTLQTQGGGLVADASNAGAIFRSNNTDPSSPPYPSSPREQKRPSFDAGSVLLQSPDMGQRASGMDQYRDDQCIPSNPRHPSLPTAGIGASPSSPHISPIVPMSAGPSYSPVAAAAAMAIPISPKPRAFAQQPTYINQSSANPSYAPPQVPKEEVCVECTMRDQDMADVDVTSPGIWERESDALYEELLRREELEESTGSPQPENPSRPRAKGDLLTEEHLKFWLSVNPKEPSSRQQTLDQYVKSQRSLLEAEALAHARAMRESRLIDDKMRDTYAQLRRSAYELGSAAQPTDDTGGVRIKAPRSTSSPIIATQAHSREVTLLENGMIMEHVDVRREEREERDRRKRDEKRERSRVRKSSRSSRGADVMSVYSLQTPMPSDSGFFSGIRGDSRYSQSNAPRPSSVMTGGAERPQSLLRVQSQASFSDLQSIGSTTSPRRSRFFGFKNLSTGWRSQDSLAPSGSMIDMHLALHKEQQYQQLANIHPDTVDIGSNAPTLRLGEAWQIPSPEPADASEVRETKKRKGLLKFWKMVTGQLDKRSADKDRSQIRSPGGADDDAPLAPPPPLSYLVDGASRRHLSTPSLPSATSPHTLSPYAASPPTAPSSLVPSPTSSRRSTADRDGSDGRKTSDQEDQSGFADSSVPESDSRGRTTQNPWMLSSITSPSSPTLSPRPRSTIDRRDKSPPPLPAESSIEFPNGPRPDIRPQTLFMYDPRTLPSSPVMNGLYPPQAAFRTAEMRRQSFGGIASKPFSSKTLPAKGVFGSRQLKVPPFLAEEKYDEFGVSRMSLCECPGSQLKENSLQVPLEKPKKRKSKFGLSSLFGKKSSEPKDVPIVEPLDFSSFRSSQDMRYMSMYVNGHEAGYASPLSANSHAPRMSVSSKKNLEALVDQDPDFIAYRYPSNDQRLDLLR